VLDGLPLLSVDVLCVREAKVRDVIASHIHLASGGVQPHADRAGCGVCLNEDASRPVLDAVLAGDLLACIRVGLLPAGPDAACTGLDGASVMPRLQTMFR